MKLFTTTDEIDKIKTDILKFNVDMNQLVIKNGDNFNLIFYFLMINYKFELIGKNIYQEFYLIDHHIYIWVQREAIQYFNYKSNPTSLIREICDATNLIKKTIIIITRDDIINNRFMQMINKVVKSINYYSNKIILYDKDQFKSVNFVENNVMYLEGNSLFVNLFSSIYSVPNIQHVSLLRNLFTIR